MATQKADSDGAAGDSAALFSIEDLRARLDAPLFHRDQGLAVPTPIPRLTELRVDHAVEAEPEAEPVPEVVAAVVVETVTEVPAAPAPRARPTLASFSDLMAATAVQTEPESSPVIAPAPTPEPAPQPIALTTELGAPETEALLAVLAGFGSTSAESMQAPAPTPVTLENPTPPGGQSRVQAELDRLAFLPDQEEPEGPVDIPVIAHSQPFDAMVVPVLSQHEMYNPRPVLVPAGRRNVFEAAFEPTSARRRAKKGGFKRLISLSIVLVVLAAGLYAAKFYLLDPKWDEAVKELANEVEVARGLNFDHAVDVTTLTADEYATRVARYALGVNESNEAQVAAELRALGLMTGPLDLRAIGLAALPETPAFYDVREEKIFIVDGLPQETYRFAMFRALAAALVDQEYGWGSQIDGEPPAVVRGTSALYEADAIATASGMLNATDRALVIEQRGGLSASYGVLATPSHFGSAVAGRLGLALRGFVEAVPIANRGDVLKGAKITDGQALDLRRLVSGVAENTDGARSQGMLFWYHVLAARMDPAAAWNAALAIALDDVDVAAEATSYCVTATLTVAPTAFEGVNAAFQAWAILAPVESATTVVSSLVDGVARLEIKACDPGIAIATNHGVAPLATGGAPLRSEQFRLLLAAQPTLTWAQAACAVYGADSVSMADERSVVDPIEGWLAPASHPAPDPSACPI